MAKPTMDELKAQDEHNRIHAAALKLCEAVAAWYDPSQGFCPFCISDEAGHRDGCPHDAFEGYLATLPIYQLRHLVPDGIDLIREERRRQIEEEGWTTEHDDEHGGADLARAAACYAIPPEMRESSGRFGWGSVVMKLVNLLWPWWESPARGAPFMNWWKPTPEDRIRELTKSGALVAAEIERLQRAALPREETA